MVRNEDKGLESPPKKSPLLRPTVGQIAEAIIGCKWSLGVLAAIRAGSTRPGEIERACEGISSKVLHERLRKLERFGLIKRFVHEVVPPHVQYEFTPAGEQFLQIIDAIDAVQRHFDGTAPLSDDA